VIKTLAHLSDLHLGRSEAEAQALVAAVAALSAARVDHVVVTGDVTHRGALDELAAFRRLTAPLADRITVVPGNHDRLGENAARYIMRGRVSVERRPGLYLVRLDSTAPHNRRLLDAHGHIGETDLAAVDQALEAAPRDTLVALLLHHHVHRLPGDDVWERLAGLVGLPWTAELGRGAALLGLARGRCDFVLHGHRHVPAELQVGGDGARPLRVANAGSSTGLGRIRLFCHAAGRLTGEGWLAFDRGGRRVDPVIRAVAAAA